MKMLSRILAITVIATVITGCYSRKERVVERERDSERPVVRERVIEQQPPSSSTTVIK